MNIFYFQIFDHYGFINFYILILVSDQLVWIQRHNETQYGPSSVQNVILLCELLRDISFTEVYIIV